MCQVRKSTHEGVPPSAVKHDEQQRTFVHVGTPLMSFSMGEVSASGPFFTCSAQQHVRSASHLARLCRALSAGQSKWLPSHTSHFHLQPHLEFALPCTLKGTIRMKKKNYCIFSSQLRADQMPGSPSPLPPEGQLMCTPFLSM